MLIILFSKMILGPGYEYIGLFYRELAEQKLNDYRKEAAVHSIDSLKRIIESYEQNTGKLERTIHRIFGEPERITAFRNELSNRL
jgi:hypothetical protein